MTTTEPRNEKRQFDRIPETVSITIKKITYPMTKDDTVKGIGKNISAGGVCFAVPHPYEPGNLLSLEINLTGWQRHKNSVAAVIDDDVAIAPLTAVAKVAWCRERPDSQGYEIGLTFKNIYEDDYQALKKYLSAAPSA